MQDERFPARGEPRFAAKLSWQVFYGWYSGFMSFIAIGGLGYNGEIGGKNFAGGVLRTVWALMIWLLRAGYTANLASAILMASLASQTSLTSKSFDYSVANYQTVCLRDSTALAAIVSESLEANQVRVVRGGGLLGDQTLGASDIRAGHCAGMAQPLWMAENALVSDGPNPSANCDLRSAARKHPNRVLTECTHAVARRHPLSPTYLCYLSLSQSPSSLPVSPSPLEPTACIL